MKRIIAVTMMLAMVFALVACGSDEAEQTLIGTWKYDGPVEYSYVFEEGGKGAYVFGETRMEFTYTDNGDSVEILYTGNTESNTYKYKIEDGKLQIEDSFGETVTYVKK